jgi:hypothetical protein
MGYFPSIRQGPHRKRTGGRAHKYTNDLLPNNDRDTNRQQGDLINLLLFFKLGESRLKRHHIKSIMNMDYTYEST